MYAWFQICVCTTGPTGWEWSVIEEKTQRNLVLMCDTREQVEY